MAKLFILIKRKGSSKWLGAIPARAGATKMQIRALMRKQLKKGFTFKIISEATMRRMMGRSRAVTRRRKVRKSRRRTSRRMSSRKRRRRTRRR